jgi:hypothetical protein
MDNHRPLVFPRGLAATATPNAIPFKPVCRSDWPADSPAISPSLILLTLLAAYVIFVTPNVRQPQSWFILILKFSGG